MREGLDPDSAKLMQLLFLLLARALEGQKSPQLCSVGKAWCRAAGGWAEWEALPACVVLLHLRSAAGRTEGRGLRRSPIRPSNLLYGEEEDEEPRSGVRGPCASCSQPWQEPGKTGKEGSLINTAAGPDVAAGEHSPSSAPLTAGVFPLPLPPREPPGTGHWGALALCHAGPSSSRRLSTWLPVGMGRRVASSHQW